MIHYYPILDLVQIFPFNPFYLHAAGESGMVEYYIQDDTEYLEYTTFSDIMARGNCMCMCHWRKKFKHKYKINQMQSRCT